MINLEDDENLILKDEHTLKENGIGRCFHVMKMSGVQITILATHISIYLLLAVCSKEQKFANHYKFI